MVSRQGKNITRSLSEQEAVYYHAVLSAFEKTSSRPHKWLLHSVWALAVMVFVTVLTLSAATAPSASSQQARLSASTTLPSFSSANGSPDIEAVYQQINSLRIANHLAPLFRNAALTELAAMRAADMRSKTYFAHNSPDGSLYSDHLTAYGYAAAYSCENLDLTESLRTQSIVSDWYTSTKGHKDCMLNGQTSDIGLAVAELITPGGNTSFVVVAIQAQPATSSSSTTR